LRSFQQRLADFERRGVHVVAISVDPVEATQKLCQRMGYTFTFLSDENREVIRRYDLLHRGAGPNHSDISRPAEFLVGSSGTIRWVNLTENIAVRARPDQILAALDEGSSR
jgi:peroxiredoxin